jgi:hypothetical protein
MNQLLRILSSVYPGMLRLITLTEIVDLDQAEAAGGFAGDDGGVEAEWEIGDDGRFGIVGERNIYRFDLGLLIGLPVVVRRERSAIAIV